MKKYSILVMIWRAILFLFVFLGLFFEPWFLVCFACWGFGTVLGSMIDEVGALQKEDKE